MVSATEQEALRIILGIKGKQPKNIAELSMQLFPNVNPRATSLDPRVQGIKGVLEKRSRPRELSIYFRFYRSKRFGVAFKHQDFLPEDLAFLEEVYQQCCTWPTFREKVQTVLKGSNLKTGVRVRRK